MKYRKEAVMIFEKISKLASEKGILISSLEKTLGFGNGTIKKWGESSPSVNKLKKVADYFGVSIEYFLE
jgi:transcriptional regulator with XRE-family HTH domain